MCENYLPNSAGISSQECFYHLLFYFSITFIYYHNAAFLKTVKSNSTLLSLHIYDSSLRCAAEQASDWPTCTFILGWMSTGIF